MFKKMLILWVAGLLTIVPYGTYYLLFEGERSEYAFLMIMVLFWIFGFWGVAGPILTGLKIRSLFKAIEQCRSKDELARLVNKPETEETVISLIANENKIPRFLARWLYKRVITRLRQQGLEG